MTLNPGAALQHRGGLSDAQRPLESGMHREAVAEEHRHPHRRGVDRQVRQVEHPPRLLPETPLLARHAVRLQRIDLRNHVEGDLAAERPTACAFLPLSMATVSPASSSMAPRPLPDTA